DDGRVRLQWNDNSENESSTAIRIMRPDRPPSEVRVDRGGERRTGKRTWLDSEATAPGTHRYVVVVTWYVPRRHDPVRLSPSEDSVVAPKRAQPPPAAPTNLTATLKPDGIEIRWMDNATNEDAYAIEVSGARKDQAVFQNRQARTGWCTYSDRATTAPG